MSDVRSLLKARRQEIRVDHPLASYTSSGQLRCSVCNVNIKHPSAWDGHLVSKAHRTNAVRVKEDERRRKERESEEDANRLKRKIPEDDVLPVHDEDIRSAAKRSRVTPAPQPPSRTALPLDFFSDPSQAPILSSNDSDDEATDAAAPPPGRADPSLDQEWLQFQQTVVNAPDAAATYDRATIVAEPELVADSSEAFASQDGPPPPESVTKTDADERRRKEQEDRELIMDRLMDEERAQEEADMKVTFMKNRLAALRKKRESTRPAKPEAAII